MSRRCSAGSPTPRLRRSGGTRSRSRSIRTRRPLTSLSSVVAANRASSRHSAAPKRNGLRQLLLRRAAEHVARSCRRFGRMLASAQGRFAPRAESLRRSLASLAQAVSSRACRCRRSPERRPAPSASLHALLVEQAAVAERIVSGPEFDQVQVQRDKDRLRSPLSVRGLAQGDRPAAVVPTAVLPVQANDVGEFSARIGR